MMMASRTYPDLNAFFRDNPDETVTQVARDVGCSMPQLSMIRWGKRQPRLAIALRIAQRCRIPLESMIVSDHTAGATKEAKESYIA